jgi:6-pyruvoyltetrahydropterin/6-carboxytetrahydropterin synthase
MIAVTKKIEFSAAHWLSSPRLSPEENRRVYGKDHNPDRHGHNYVLEVTVKGEPDPRTGLLMNFRDLKKLLMEEVYDKADHRDLSGADFLKGAVPTAENLAVAFWGCLARKLPPGVALDTVRLYETETGWVTYRGD